MSCRTMHSLRRHFGRFYFSGRAGHFPAALGPGAGPLAAAVRVFAALCSNQYSDPVPRVHHCLDLHFYGQRPVQPEVDILVWCLFILIELPAGLSNMRAAFSRAMSTVAYTPLNTRGVIRVACVRRLDSLVGACRLLCAIFVGLLGSSASFFMLVGVFGMQHSGEECRDFLQNLTTNDVNAMRPGEARPTAILNTKGRTLHPLVMYYGFIAGTGTEPAFYLDCDASQTASLLRSLKRYKLRSKVDLQDLTDELHVMSVLPEGGSIVPLALQQQETVASEESPLHAVERLRRAIAAEGDGFFVWDPRSWSLGLRGLVRRDGMASERIQSEGTDVGHHTYDTMKTIAGVPDSADLAGLIPLEWNIAELNGAVFDKGCYVGQELMARTHFTGILRKRLFPVALLPSAASASRGIETPWHKTHIQPLTELPWLLDHSPVPSFSSVRTTKGDRAGRFVAALEGTNLAMCMLRLEQVEEAMRAAVRGEDQGKLELVVDEGGHVARAIPIVPPYWDAIEATQQEARERMERA